MQCRKGEVLELPLDLLDPEAVRERRVDVEGLLGGRSLGDLGHDRDRAHVVQTVGELDEQDAPVRRHGEEHLADGGGLLGLLRVELEAVELGDAVDDAGDDLAELLFDVLEAHTGVLDRVVQEGGFDGGRVKAELGNRQGDGGRVGDVVLAGPAGLASVGALGCQGGRDDRVGRLAGAQRFEGLEDRPEQLVEVVVELATRWLGGGDARHHDSLVTQLSASSACVPSA